MKQWKALDLVDKVLRECSGNDQPFGGKVLLLGETFDNVWLYCQVEVKPQFWAKGSSSQNPGPNSNT